MQQQVIFKEPRQQRAAVAVIMLALLGCSLGLSYAAIHQPDSPVVVDGLGFTLPPGWSPPAGTGRTNLGQTVSFTDPEGLRRRLEVTRFALQRPQAGQAPPIADVLRVMFARVLVGSTLGPDAPIETGMITGAAGVPALRYAMWTGVRQQRFGRAVSQPQLWSLAVIGPAEPGTDAGSTPYWALVYHDQRSGIDPAEDAPAQQGWLRAVLTSARVVPQIDTPPTEQTR